MRQYGKCGDPSIVQPYMEWHARIVHTACYNTGVLASLAPWCRLPVIGQDEGLDMEEIASF